MKLQDTPYSFSVLSSAFIENTDSYATPGGGALDKSPFYSSTYTDQRGIVSSGSQRGINNNGAGNFYRIDGLSAPFTSSTYGVEPYDRIEIMSGVSGFMYGISPAAGFLNYVMKQPTADPYASLTLSAPNGATGYAHADVGATSNDGRFGYRINVVGQDGATIVNGQDIERGLVSGAFTYHLGESAVLEVDGLASHYKVTGAPAIWYVLPGTQFPVPPNPRLIWSEPYAQLETSTWSTGSRFTADLTDWATVRAAFRYTNQSFGPEIQGFNFLGSGGQYSQYLSANAPQIAEAYSGYSFVDFKFDTFSIEHKLTAGWSGQQENYIKNINSFAAEYVSGFSLASPTYIPNPNFLVGNLGNYRDDRVILQTYSVGDQIDFNKYFSALLGGSLTSIGDSTYDTSNVLTSGYFASMLTPTYALLFKPVSWVTAYASYIEGLQEGLVVNNTLATNNGAVLPPYLRKQYEAGVKATVGNTLLTFAYFDIDSALQYELTNPNGTVTYVESGRQVSRGVEFSATGTIAEGTRLLGGFMFTDSRVVKDEANPSYDGTIPQGAVTSLIKATVEHDLEFLRGATLTGGAYRTGGVYADQANTQWVPGHTTFDAGVRYTTKIYGHDVIGRVFVSNLTDARYWLGPYTVSDPRRFSTALQMRW